ncbi:helix-turn-helix domain-containing protein [Novosphingobium sp. ZN18A2]|uniref:TetR/AcrR family transcriptional regulator n=1 Tax=Novosphingobium sp. ZN18A2 TaxID=3079861 RepID=UPI0030CB5C94
MYNLDGPSPVVSQRERGKERRRALIRSAARELLRKTGPDGFSMRELADRANVSPATPYNLFGTKAGVLIAVFDADLQEFRQAFERIPSADPVAHLFDFVDTAFAFFQREPEFYRNMLAPIAASSSGELRRGIIDPRATVYADLIKGLVDGDVLRPGISGEALLRTITNLMTIGVLNWINEDSALTQSRADVQTGFAFVLLAACRETFAPFLRGKLIPPAE